MIRFSAMALQSQCVLKVQKGKESCTGQARDTCAELHKTSTLTVGRTSPNLSANLTR